LRAEEGRRIGAQGLDANERGLTRCDACNVHLEECEESERRQRVIQFRDWGALIGEEAMRP
jgi:hypothetical protein